MLVARDERLTSALASTHRCRVGQRAPQLAAAGYEEEADFSGKTMEEVQRFYDRGYMDALYVEQALPPTFEHRRTRNVSS